MIKFNFHDGNTVTSTSIAEFLNLPEDSAMVQSLLAGYRKASGNEFDFDTPSKDLILAAYEKYFAKDFTMNATVLEDSVMSEEQLRGEKIMYMGEVEKELFFIFANALATSIHMRLLESVLSEKMMSLFGGDKNMAESMLEYIRTSVEMTMEEAESVSQGVLGNNAIIEEDNGDYVLDGDLYLEAFSKRYAQSAEAEKGFVKAVTEEAELEEMVSEDYMPTQEQEDGDE